MAIEIMTDEEIDKAAERGAVLIVNRIPEGGTIPVFDDALGLGQNVESACSRCGHPTYERPYNNKKLARVCLHCICDQFEAEGGTELAADLRRIDKEDREKGK